MKYLSDWELDQLLNDAVRADQHLRPTGNHAALVPRLKRLLDENRTLRDQAAEALHMSQLEHGG